MQTSSNETQAHMAKKSIRKLDEDISTIPYFSGDVKMEVFMGMEVFM